MAIRGGGGHSKKKKKKKKKKKNILNFMVSGDSMHLLFCVLSIEIGWHID